MFEIEYIKEMTREDGSKVDVVFTRQYERPRPMYQAVLKIAADCIHEGAWMQFKYIGPTRQ